MIDERRLQELEDINRRLLDANTSLQRNLARLESLFAGARYRISIFLAVVIVLLMLVSTYPLALSYAQTVFNPTRVPKDYGRVNKFIQENGVESTKVFWLPLYRQGFKYTWAPEKRIGPFNSLSSNPSLGNIQDPFNPNSYINWLEMLWRPFFPDVTLKSEYMMFKPNLASRLLVPFSARYVIVDSSVPGYDFDSLLAFDTSLEPVFSSGKLRVYEISGAVDNIWPAVQTLKVHSFWDNLAIMQKLYGEPLTGVAFIDGRGSVRREYGQLDMRDFESGNLLQNPGFEKGYGWVPFLFWNQPQTNIPYTISPDKKTRVSGRQSLKVTNRSTKAYEIGWVTSDEVPAVGDSVYTFSSNVKYRNANWTNVSVEGYDQETDKWVLLAQSPGIRSKSADWRKYYISFYLPNVITKLRVLAGAGWSLNADQGAAVSWFDDIRLTRVDDTFFTAIQNRRNHDSVKVTYRKLSPTKYAVRVRNKGGPFVLVFGEAHDPWVAKLPTGEKVQAVPLYGTTCGFPIGEKGTFDLVIEYPPENWFHIGFVVSMATLLLCVVYLLLGRKKGYGTVGRAMANSVRVVRTAVRSGGTAPGTETRDRARAGPGKGLRFTRERDGGAREPGSSAESTKGRRAHRPLTSLRKLGAKIREAIEAPPRRRL